MNKYDLKEYISLNVVLTIINLKYILKIIFLIISLLFLIFNYSI
jgi:hypothetical protein